MNKTHFLALGLLGLLACDAADLPEDDFDQDVDHVDEGGVIARATTQIDTSFGGDGYQASLENVRVNAILPVGNRTWFVGTRVKKVASSPIPFFQDTGLVVGRLLANGKFDPHFNGGTALTLTEASNPTFRSSPSARATPSCSTARASSWAVARPASSCSRAST
jgi:hypothetical protein